MTDDPPHDLVLIAANAMRDAGIHPCAVEHVDWRFLGGANCGCEGVSGCSVPVYGCTFCNDSDYGDNDEAREQRRKCGED